MKEVDLSYNEFWQSIVGPWRSANYLNCAIY